MSSVTYSGADLKISFSFGKSQLLTNERMRRSPRLAALIFRIFGYTNIGNWARSTIVVDLLKKLPLRDFRRIMDLGAGLGEFTFMLAEALPHAQVTALEIMDERINLLHNSVKAGKFSNVTVYGDKIETLSEREVYDFIFAVDVFEHIREHEMPFGECFRKLKPGGYFMVKIPNVTQRTILPESWFEEHNEWLEDEHVGQVYDLKGLEARFVKENFKIIHASYSDGWLSRLGWELGYLTKKGGSFSQLLFLPLCKFLVHLDRFFFRSPKRGNAIQVIGQKPTN